MHSFRLKYILIFLTVVILFPPADSGAGSGKAGSRDSAKVRIERVKAFFLRSSDELGMSLEFVNETTGLLMEQVEAAGREPGNKAEERRALLDWYQKYADWLRGMSAEMEIETSNYFSGKKSGSEWTGRYEELSRGSRKLADELDGKIRKLDKEKTTIDERMKKLNRAVLERRVLVDKDDLELARELWPSYRVSYDQREAVYKALTNEEVARLEIELRLLRERQKYFDCLAELGTYELVWLEIKAGDFDILSNASRVIGGEDPEAAASALRGVIRTYEADMAALRRKSAELNAKIHGLTRTGTLNMLDRLEELARHYETMKSRFDRHTEWLSGQIGSYQADLVEINKEL